MADRTLAELAQEIVDTVELIYTTESKLTFIVTKPEMQSLMQAGMDFDRYLIDAGVRTCHIGFHVELVVMETVSLPTTRLRMAG